MTAELGERLIEFRSDGSLRPPDLWSLTAASLEFSLEEHEVNGVICKGKVLGSGHPLWEKYLTALCSGCGADIRTKSLTEGPWVIFENSTPQIRLGEI